MWLRSCKPCCMPMSLLSNMDLNVVRTVRSWSCSRGISENLVGVMTRFRKAGPQNYPQYAAARADLHMFRAVFAVSIG